MLYQSKFGRHNVMAAGGAAPQQQQQAPTSRQPEAATPAPAPGAGVPSGPGHEDAGMQVIDPATGQPQAEIEGGERIFSKEDTAALEQMAMGVQQMMDSGDEQAASEAAMQLGFSVVEMLTAQNQAQGEQQAAEPGMDYMEYEDSVPMGQ
jgi:hypothetical protein